MIQIAIGERTNRLLKQALRDTKVNLQDLMIEGWPAEISDFQASEVQKDSAGQ